MLVLDQQNFWVCLDYFSLIHMLLIFFIISFQLMFYNNIKKLFFFKQFVRWTLLLSVKYLLFNCWIYLQKKTYCKNHEKNLFWWWKWAITFLFTIFRIWSLRIDRSIWSIHLLSIAVALLVDSNDIDFLMFHVKSTSFTEVVKSHIASANSKMLN